MSSTEQATHKDANHQKQDFQDKHKTKQHNKTPTTHNRQTPKRNTTAQHITEPCKPTTNKNAQSTLNQTNKKQMNPQFPPPPSPPSPPPKKKKTPKTQNRPKAFEAPRAGLGVIWKPGCQAFGSKAHSAHLHTSETLGLEEFYCPTLNYHNPLFCKFLL